MLSVPGCLLAFRFAMDRVTLGGLDFGQGTEATKLETGSIVCACSGDVRCFSYLPATLRQAEFRGVGGYIDEAGVEGQSNRTD